MSNTRSKSAKIETLENRLLCSSTARAVGYLPDYHFENVANKLDWSALTQVNYFSVVPDAATGQLPGTTSDLPEESSSGYDLSQLTTAVQLAHSHNVKIDIVVGGAGLDSSLIAVAGDSDLRNTFADSVQSFANKYHVDGVDLDWEPLNPSATQISNYASLIHALRTRTSGLELSAAVNPEHLPVAGQSSQYVLNTQAIKDLDTIAVMTYDLDYAFHAEWTRSTNDMQGWASYLNANGVSKSKLLFGLPFYGRAGTSWGNSQEETYNDIINGYIAQTGNNPSAAADNLDVSFNDKFGGSAVTWYFNGKTTIANKTQYAVDNSFGGVMIWDLGQDHFNSQGQYDSYSLLPVIKSIVKGTTGPVTGTISGNVFADNNSNGVKNTGENGIGGVVVYIDTNNNSAKDASEKSTTTAADGSFTLTGLAAGSYKIRQVIPSGEKQTTPSNGYGWTVSLAAGQVVTGKNFGDVITAVPKASIGGTVFNDANGNQVKGAGELGLSSWTVFLDTNNNGKLDSGELSKVTDSSGNYLFSGLSAGNYLVRVLHKTGWTQTTPTNNYGQHVTLLTSQVRTGVLVGERHQA